MSSDSDQRPLKILQVGTQLGVGGITRHIVALTSWLRGRDHRISLAGTPDVWINETTEEAFLPLPTRYVAGEGANLPVRFYHTGRAVWTLRRWLRKNPVDLIHAHESAPALVAHLARTGLNIPLAITYHGSEPERIASFGRIARVCDLVITPSHASARDLAGPGGVAEDRLKVIGLGVKRAPEDLPEEIAALRQDLLGDGNHVIVTIARLMYQKGIDILIDCAREIHETHPGARFVVVGDGPDEAMLHALAREKGVDGYLRFVGRSERPHLYLRAADLFLLTSRWEALPFTIAEAFQAGTPSLATACSGVVELIDETVGVTVPIGDIAAICKGVGRILDDTPGRQAMAEAALVRSREDRFDPDWVHARFEEIYRLLARS